jgi:hypothetical protein
VLLDDPAAAIATLRRLYPELPEEVARQVALGLPARLSRDGIYTRDEIQRLQDDLIATDPTIRPQPYETIVPLRLVPEKATRAATFSDSGPEIARRAWRNS